MDIDKELLKKIPLLASLSDDDLGGLQECLESRTLPPNQVIFWTGEKGEELFIVQFGRVRLSYASEAGHDVTLAVVGAGAFFGDLSLLDGGPRSATAVTQSETGMWVLSRHHFYQFLAQHPQASAVMISTMATRLRENTARLRGLKNANEEADEKIKPSQRFVAELAQLFSSGSFLIFVMLAALGWIVMHTLLVLREHPEKITFLDEPPTFAWLGSMMTLASFFLTVFVLNSQKQQSERDRIRTDFEYQVNLKAQHEIMQLHHKADKLQQTVEQLSQRTHNGG